MTFFDLLLIALSLAMDAFAVAVTIGLSMPNPTIKHMLIVGLYFGIFQAVMPLIGYLLGTQFAQQINIFGFWISFILLAFIGGKMIFDSLLEGKNHAVKHISVSYKNMIPLAFATSIDAAVIGVSFSLVGAEIISALWLIGVITLVLSVVGVKIGQMFGVKFKSKAEFLGGLVLILMGIRILLDGLNII